MLIGFLQKFDLDVRQRNYTFITVTSLKLSGYHRKIISKSLPVTILYVNYGYINNQLGYQIFNSSSDITLFDTVGSIFDMQYSSILIMQNLALTLYMAGARFAEGSTMVAYIPRTAQRSA